jgi:hypothetical protein
LSAFERSLVSSDSNSETISVPTHPISVRGTANFGVTFFRSEIFSEREISEGKGNRHFGVGIIFGVTK